MKKFLFLLLFLNLFQSLNAQSSPSLKELINNKDITWIGEYESYFPFELDNSFLDTLSATKILNYTAGGSMINSSEVYSKKSRELLGVENFTSYRLKQMKSFPPENQPNFYQYQLYKLICDWVRNKKLKAYSDADLSKEIPTENIEKIFVKIDTIFHFDPETKEKIKQVIVNELSTDIVQKCKLKFYVYFNNLNKSWNILAHSLAPVINIYGYDNKILKFRGYEDLFWIPVENSAIPLNYTDINYPEVRKTDVDVSFSKAKVIKNIKSPVECNDILFEEVKKAKGDKVIYNSYWYNEPINNNKLKDIDISVDTIITFHPETFEEIITTTTKKFSGKDVSRLRIVQDWFWDDKEKKIKVNFSSYAPIIERKWNDNLESSFWPSFYEKMLRENTKDNQKRN